MNAALALPGNSDSTFLTHLLARGLEDDRSSRSAPRIWLSCTETSVIR